MALVPVEPKRFTSSQTSCLGVMLQTEVSPIRNPNVTQSRRNKDKLTRMRCTENCTIEAEAGVKDAKKWGVGSCSSSKQRCFRNRPVPSAALVKLSSCDVRSLHFAFYFESLLFCGFPVLAYRKFQLQSRSELSLQDSGAAIETHSLGGGVCPPGCFLSPEQRSWPQTPPSPQHLFHSGATKKLRYSG